MHSNKIDTSVHHLEIVPFSLQVTDVPDPLVLAQVMVPPQGLDADVLRALSGARLWECAVCPWLHFGVAGMGPWVCLATSQGTAQPGSGHQGALGCLLCQVPLGAHSLM